MGKLLEMLEQASRGVVQPLGFARSRKEKVPPLLLLGCAKFGDGDAVSRVVEAGFHALVWTGAESVKEGQWASSAKGLNNLVWGTWKKDLDATTIGGVDFEVFSSEETPIGSFEDEDEERTVVMEVAPELDESALRTLEDLPVDVIMVSLVDAPALTVRQLMRIARVRGFNSKYLLLHLAMLPSKEELGVLREAGVSGLVVNAADHAVGELKAFRARLEELPSAAPHRRNEKRIATLPPLRMSPRPAHQEEEDDDDDDEEHD